MKVEPLIHPLWTKAVGTPDYDKQEWNALQAAIMNLEVQHNELLAACELALKRLGAPITHYQDAYQVLTHVIAKAKGGGK